MYCKKILGFQIVDFYCLISRHLDKAVETALQLSASRFCRKFCNLAKINPQK